VTPRSAANAVVDITSQPWAEQAHDVVEHHETDPGAGLSSEAAAERLQQLGPNEIAQTPPTPLWRRLAAQFNDPLVLLLLAAIVISLIAWWSDGLEGFPIEAAVIAAIVLLNAGIGTWQESRALDAVAALRRLSALQSSVIRDGRAQRAPISCPATSSCSLREMPSARTVGWSRLRR
jgi:magnesium-transporting ATPase (P-type)